MIIPVTNILERSKRKSAGAPTSRASDLRVHNPACPDLARSCAVPIVAPYAESLSSRADRVLNSVVPHRAQQGNFPKRGGIKLLYLVLNHAAEKWKRPPREWFEAKTQFAVFFGHCKRRPGSGTIGDDAVGLAEKLVPIRI